MAASIGTGRKATNERPITISLTVWQSVYFSRFWAAACPIEQLDHMNEWKGAAPGKPIAAADVAGGDDVRLHAGNGLQFPRAQALGKIRLQQAIGSGAATAKVRIGQRHNRKARLFKKPGRQIANPLAVMKATGRLIGDCKTSRHRVRRRDAKGFHNLADVFGKGRNPRRLFQIGRIVAEKISIVLHHRSATGSVDDNGVISIPGVIACPDCRHPAIQIRSGQRLCARRVAEMQKGRPATPHPFYHHHLTAKAGEKPHACPMDGRPQTFLNAAFQKKHPATAFAFRLMHARPGKIGAQRQMPGHMCNGAAKTPRQMNQPWAAKPA